MSESFEFDTIGIRAVMMFPSDLKEAERIREILMRDRAIRNIRAKGEWPISLDREIFDLLIDTPSVDSMRPVFEERRRLGWTIAMAYHHYLNAAGGFSWDDDTRAAIKESGTERRFLEIGFKLYGDKKIPGLDVPMEINRYWLNKAKREVWASAHYWATLFLPTGEKRKEPSSAQDWEIFMMLAETYRVLGMGAGIFGKLAPKGVDPSAPIFDSRFPPFEGINAHDLRDDQIDWMKHYRAVK